MTRRRKPKLRPRFWEHVPLDQMTHDEWEALCDGCGKCCQLKLEDADTAEISYTTVACRLLDPDTCRCTNYPLRKRLVPDCIVMTPETLAQHMYWLPATCAYKLRANGQPLAAWHPLISGDSDSVHRAGISHAGRIVHEYEVDEDDLEDYVIEEQI